MESIGLKNRSRLQAVTTSSTNGKTLRCAIYDGDDQVGIIHKNHVGDIIITTHFRDYDLQIDNDGDDPIIRIVRDQGGNNA